MEDLVYVEGEEKKNILELQQKADRLVSIGAKIVIGNSDQLSMANSWLVGAKRFLNEWEVERKKITVPINLGLTNINNMFGRVEDFVNVQYSRVGEGVLGYRAKLKEEADDKKRKADEAARKIEENQKSELKKQADELESKGHVQAADNLRDAARAVVAPVAQTEKFENTVDAGDGSVGGRGKIVVTIEDDDHLKLEFIKSVASGLYPIYLVKLDTSEIKSYVKKNKLFGRNVMPGITVAKKESLIVTVE
jgi:hypothetical protein